MTELPPELREALAQVAEPPQRVELVDASSVQPKQQEWLWTHRMPLGTVTLTVGPPGLGKTTLLAQVAARVTRGELPGDCYGEPGAVLFASAEDSIEATLVPRLMAADADLARVHFIKADTLMLPDDTITLAERAAEVGAVMVAVDPLVAFLAADVNAHRDQDVRRALAPLARMADEMRLAVVPVLHLNKRAGGDVTSRVGGSIGLVGAARSVLALGAHPDDQDGERLVLATGKANLAKRQGMSLACHVEERIVTVGGEAIVTSALVFAGECTVTADDLLAERERSSHGELDEAREFLLGELADGPVLAKDVLAGAKALGIAERTLRRAKTGMAKSRKGDGGSGQRWYWELLPEAAKQGSHGGHVENLGHVGNVGHLYEGGAAVGKAAKVAKESKAANISAQGTGGQLPPADTDWTPAAADEFIRATKAKFPGSYEVDAHGRRLP
jgi:hypothetical protein